MKANNLIKKWVKDLNSHLDTENIQTAKYVYEKMQTDTMKYHYTAIRMTKIQNTDTTRCWQECRAKQTLTHYWLECKVV